MNIKSNLRTRDIIYFVLILLIFSYNYWLTTTFTKTIGYYEEKDLKNKDLIIYQAHESYLAGCQQLAQKSCGGNKDLCQSVLESCKIDSAVYQFKVLDFYKDK